jgi:hypothetical protein
MSSPQRTSVQGAKMFIAKSVSAPDSSAQRSAKQIA